MEALAALELELSLGPLLNKVPFRNTLTLWPTLWSPFCARSHNAYHVRSAVTIILCIVCHVLMGDTHLLKSGCACRPSSHVKKWVRVKLAFLNWPIDPSPKGNEESRSSIDWLRFGLNRLGFRIWFQFLAVHYFWILIRSHQLGQWAPFWWVSYGIRFWWRFELGVS